MLNRIVLLLSILFVFGSCQVNKKSSIENEIVRGLNFDCIEYHISRKSNDTIFIRGKLKQDEIIEGYPCKSDNWTYFSKNWGLNKCRLSSDFTINSYGPTPGH